MKQPKYLCVVSIKGYHGKEPARKRIKRLISGVVSPAIRSAMIASEIHEFDIASTHSYAKRTLKIKIGLKDEADMIAYTLKRVPLSYSRKIRMVEEIRECVDRFMFSDFEVDSELFDERQKRY